MMIKAAHSRNSPKEKLRAKQTPPIGQKLETHWPKACGLLRNRSMISRLEYNRNIYARCFDIASRLIKQRLP